MALYYPDQTMVLPMTTIRRERLLPPDAFGEVLVNELQRVDAYTVVARGVIPARYLLLDLMTPFGLSDPAQVLDYIQVEPGAVVEAGQVLAADRTKKRGPVLRAPAGGLVSQLIDGRLVLETDLTTHEIRAGFTGTVTSVRPGRGVLLETTGALIQGVWGNGQSVFGLLKSEPMGGLTALESGEFVTEWRGAIVVTAGPLTRDALRRAVTAGLGGLIGPSMHAHLREFALGLKIPIMLTEGFGAERMSAPTHGLLMDCAGKQAALEARVPQRWQGDRPEVIVPQVGERHTAPPARDEPLRLGGDVRITRSPYLGMVGKIKSLPTSPQAIENGLRLLVAEVQLPTGRTVKIPLANLELFGRG